MLAAGTGLTPMLPIISWRLRKEDSKTELFLFNKTEEDIVADDWTPVRWDDEHIQVGSDICCCNELIRSLK